MRYIFVLFLCLSKLVAGENDSLSTITVHATARVEIPADMVIFNVTVFMEKEDPQLAFNEHKYIVKRLLDLISEFDIADSNITYSLLNMRPSEKIRRQQFGEEKYYTYTASQIVKITFYNVKSYLEFQIELLKMGFNQFSSSFSSTHVKGLKEEGYKKALLVAEENAIIIAKNIGKKLGSIVQIITETSDKFEFEQPTALRNIRLDRATSLTDIEQTVSVVTRLRVVYKIF